MRTLFVVSMLMYAAPVLAQTDWLRASPGGGGAFFSVDVSVTGKVLVGSDLSGIYMRTNAGPWTRLGKDDGLNRTSFTCVRWSPATGESALAGGRNGLYISTNAGVSWQAAAGPASFQNNFFAAIGWSRSLATTVYAAGATNTADTTVLVWRSLDGGASWNPVSHNLPSSEALRALKLVVHPTDPNTLLMITGPDGTIAPTVLIPKRALYVSTDGGSTWTLKSGADEALDVAVHPTIPGLLLMTTSTGTDNTGWVKRSTDGGDTWSLVANNTGAVWWDLPNAYLINIGLDACGSIPANAGKFMSSDGGLSWSRIDNGSTWEIGWSDCPHARGIPDNGVANALSAKGEYWVTSQFVWRYVGGQFTNAFSISPAPGRWISNGVDNAVPVCIADAQDSGTLYTGYYDLGLWRTDNWGATWKMINPQLNGWNGVGGNATSVVADSARPGVVWATIAESSKAPYQFRLFHSTTSGDAWSQTATGLPFPAFLDGLTMDRRSPVQARVLWVTANGALYRSADDGATWQPASTAGGLPTTGLFVIEVDRRDGNTIFVGGWSGLWRSLDGGANWVKLSAGFDHTSVPGEIGALNNTVHRAKWHGPHQILSDPITPGKVWVTSYMKDTTEIAPLHRGLYLSTDNGASWTELRRGPHYRGIAIDSLGRRAMVTSSPATTSGINSNAIEATQGIEDGRSTNGLTWSWTLDPHQPDIRYPFGWAVYAGGAGQRWVGIPGYGFMRKSNAPIAVKDTFAVDENSSGNLLDVLLNDYDYDPGDTISLVILDVRLTQGDAVIVGDAVSYTPPPGFAGVDRFGYVIHDNHGVAAATTVVVNVIPTVPDTVVVAIASGSDDAEESAAGVMNLTSSDLDLTQDLTQQTVGLRFAPVAVPPGATIVNAFVRFRVDETSSDATTLVIRGQAADNAPTFTSASGNISSRPVTAASTPWTPPPWTTVGASGPDQQTPDLSAIIAEIVQRPGWSGGQAIALIISGPGRRVAESWNLSPGGAPTLHIMYLPAPGTVAVEEETRSAAFAIHGVRPTPSRGAIHVELSLPDVRPAHLELIDVTGRRVEARDLGALGPGRHRVSLAGRLPAGIYLVRLTQGGEARSAKAVVLD